MDQTAEKPHHFSTLLHHLFKVQGLLVSCQWIEACLQTVVEHNPWFPDGGSFDWAFGTRSMKMLNDLPGRERIFQLIWCLWALIKAVILPFQGNSSPHNFQQQTEHLLHEYELDDETLQKANISEFSYKPCPSCSKCSSSASRHKSKSLSFAWT